MTTYNNPQHNGYDDGDRNQDLHTFNDRATPEMWNIYRHALLLHTIFTNKEPPKDWINLNFYQVCTSGQTHFNQHAEKGTQ